MKISLDSRGTPRGEPSLDPPEDQPTRCTACGYFLYEDDELCPMCGAEVDDDD